MSSRYDHRMMFKGLKKYIAQGMDFFKAARKAGYSDSTLKIKGERLKRRAGLLPERPPKTEQGMVYVQEWSPVSGLPLPPHPPTKEVKPEAKPVEKPFIPEKFFDPALGECFRTANGAAVPIWVRRDEFSGGSLNLGNLPMPGDAERRSAWAKFYADQNRLACSYQTNRDAPLPPPIYTVKEEERKPRGYKDAGVDVAGDALAGRYGLGRMVMKGE